MPQQLLVTGTCLTKHHAYQISCCLEIAQYGNWRPPTAQIKELLVRVMRSKICHIPTLIVISTLGM